MRKRALGNISHYDRAGHICGCGQCDKVYCLGGVGVGGGMLVGGELLKWLKFRVSKC